MLGIIEILGEVGTTLGALAAGGSLAALFSYAAVNQDFSSLENGLSTIGKDIATTISHILGHQTVWEQNKAEAKYNEQATKVNNSANTIINIIENFTLPTLNTYDPTLIFFANMFYPNEMKNINNVNNELIKHTNNLKNASNELKSLQSGTNKNILTKASLMTINIAPFVGGSTHEPIGVSFSHNEGNETLSKQYAKILNKNGLLSKGQKLTHEKTYSHKILGIENDSSYSWVFKNGISVPNIQKVIDFIKTAIENMIKAILGLNKVLDKVIADTTSVLGGIVDTEPPELANVVDTINELEQLELKGMLTKDLLKFLNWLRSLIGTRTITKTKEKEKDDNGKKKKPKKKPKPKKKGKKRKNRKIKEMIFNTSNSSRWIKEIRFVFPRFEKLDSDNKGSLYFVLKHPVNVREIRYKRVNRGTFSTIVMWNMGSKLGVGYLYWSQFNKKRIVNKNVLSYSLKRITAQDREISIDKEIRNKKVKYK